MNDLPTTQTPSKAKKAKKLPFKPTALKKQASKGDAPADKDKAPYGDGLELFRRAKEMQSIVEADCERRLWKKKRKREEERRRAAATAGKRPCEEEDDHDGDSDRAGRVTSSATRDTSAAFRGTTPVNVDGDSFGEKASDLVTPPGSKRSRLRSSPAKHINPASSVSASGTRTRKPAVVALESPRSQGASAKLSSPIPVPIVLSDSEDDTYAATPTPRKNGDDGNGVATMGSSFAATDEDDEFADYVRKAEEQRRKQAVSEANRKMDAAKESILILVTSPVLESKACQMKYLYDRPLRVVKDTWLAMQKQKGLLVDREDKDEFVLTWRRKKVYASSTLLHLGIRPEGNGRAVVDGLGTRGMGDNRTQVHMEVWTKAQFEAMECEEDLRRKREAGELPDDGDSPGNVPDEPPAVEVKLRVILKARGLEDVKLTVRPETTIETLITGFRRQQPSALGKDVGIWFDGDRLEEHMTMDEVEIDDLDTLEVHIK
ncbi:hypothetical protein E4U42_001301 [Claviceps africana]|uniref:Ubiquitin-like domain-containing protein n=1 Tax=Claviceps africana TaxID=83212 RepID=A0A8K0NF75_9HYPO|nr:hypothetical protein E4U42_001301 [Claviceps africana]